MKLIGNLNGRPLPWRAFAADAMLVLASVSAQAADYPTTILADNPVAYYRLEELAGATTAFDATTNHLDASYNYNSADSPELGQPGIDTNSILFSYGPGGPSDYGDVKLPTSALLAPVQADGISGAPFSAECWVLATTFSTPDYIVPLAMSGAYGGPNPNGSGWNFYQSQTSPQTWQIFMRTANQVAAIGNAPVTLLQWTHLAVTWDGTTATFYVNGQTNAAQALPNYLADPGAADGVIGGGGQTGHGNFEGGVDEVAFYDTALTGAQILNHYNVGTNSIRKPLAPPSFVSQPTVPATLYSGTPVTLTALVAGTAPLSYQWFRNTNAIVGQTNGTFTFTPVYPADNGASYYVQVTNSIGSTNSATNVLALQTNLNVIAPPFSITRNAGSHAAFRVAVGGALPIGYQWFSSGDGMNYTLLTNQTADTLWLTNVQMALSGNQYAVIVTNPFTSYSNAASLTVQARAVTVPLTGYGAVVAADNPVAFLRLNEPTNAATATDAVGSFDGTYNNTLGPVDWQAESGVPGDTNEFVGLFDTQFAIAGQGGVVDIPYALELNPYGTWSFEGWFEPTYQDTTNFHTVCSSMVNSNSSAGLWGWLIYQHPASAFTLVTFNGTGAPATFISDFAHIPLITNSWYHLALVDDGASIKMYVNGVAGSAVGPASLYVPNGINGDPSLNAKPAVLAQRSDGAFFGFNGGVADVAFYNYPLSAGQIAAHAAGKATLTFAKVNGKIVLTWPAGTLLGTTNITQPFQPVSGAVSPYTIPAGGSEGFYEVVVH